MSVTRCRTLATGNLVAPTKFASFQQRRAVCAAGALGVFAFALASVATRPNLRGPVRAACRVQRIP